MVKINLAIDRLPSFTADPTDGQAEHHTGSVEMAPTMEFIERAFIDAREGRPAAAPFSDGVIPTTLDQHPQPRRHRTSSRCSPSGCPPTGAEEPHTEELDAYADRLIDLYDEVAPGFRDSVIARDVVGPHEMETEYGLVGGNIFHGELSLEQLFHLRPGARVRRLPDAGRGPLQRLAPPPTPAAGCAGSPGCRRPGPRCSDARRRRWSPRRRLGAGGR